MWKTVSCAVQGIGHQKAGIPCQDKTFSLEEKGVHVIALADGAGSARLSHFGADRLVHDAARHLAEHFYDYLRWDDGREVKRELMELFRHSLAQEAQLRQCEVRELASTLLLAAADEAHFLLVHIGDGVIGFLDAGVLKVASTPDNGEFSNVTTFVTSAEALGSMRLFKGELKAKSAFVLMSDGTEHSLYHKPTKTLAEVVVRLMHRTCLVDGEAMQRQLEEAFVSVIAQNTQDDCSIAILARPSDSLPPLDELDYEKKCDLYGMARTQRSTQKRVDRWDTILAVTETPCTLRQIAEEIHLNPKYTKQRLNRMLSLGLLVKDGNLYRKN